MDQLDDVLSRLDRFFKTYEELSKMPTPAGANPALVESGQIARLEQKIDGIATWVQRIDERFAALVELFEREDLSEPGSEQASADGAAHGQGLAAENQARRA